MAAYETVYTLTQIYNTLANVFYFVKMRNVSRNSNITELNGKKLVDKIITYFFIEWNNMI